MITRANIEGAAVSIADATVGSLPWDTPLGPDTLLDITAPLLPLVLASGVYAVTASLSPTVVMTAGGFYIATLALAAGVENAYAQACSASATATDTQPDVSLACTWYIPAGGAIALRVINHDGAAARTFGISDAFVQRLS